MGSGAKSLRSIAAIAVAVSFALMLVAGCSSTAPIPASFTGTPVTSAAVGDHCGTYLQNLNNTNDPTSTQVVDTRHNITADAAAIYICHVTFDGLNVSSTKSAQVPASLTSQFVTLLSTDVSTRTPKNGCFQEGGGASRPNKAVVQRGSDVPVGRSKSTKPTIIFFTDWTWVIVRTSSGQYWLSTVPANACGFPNPDLARLSQQALANSATQIAADSTLFTDLQNAANSLENYYTQAHEYPTTAHAATAVAKADAIQPVPGDHLVISTDGVSNYCITGWNKQSSYAASHPKLFDSALGGLQPDYAACSQHFDTKFSVP